MPLIFAEKIQVHLSARSHFSSYAPVLKCLLESLPLALISTMNFQCMMPGMWSKSIMGYIVSYSRNGYTNATDFCLLHCSVVLWFLLWFICFATMCSCSHLAWTRRNSMATASTTSCLVSSVNAALFSLLVMLHFLWSSTSLHARSLAHFWHVLSIYERAVEWIEFYKLSWLFLHRETMFMNEHVRLASFGMKTWLCLVSCHLLELRRTWHLRPSHQEGARHLHLQGKEPPCQERHPLQGNTSNL